MKNQRILNILTGVWFLCSLLLSSIYDDNYDLDGLYIKLFLLGVFTSPVWMIQSWRYISGKFLSWKITLPYYFLLAIWFFVELDQRNNCEVLVFLTAVGFTVIGYFSDTYPSKPKLFNWIFKFLILIRNNIKQSVCAGLIIILLVFCYSINADYVEKKKEAAYEKYAIEQVLARYKYIQCKGLPSNGCASEKQECASLSDYSTIENSYECQKSMALQLGSIKYEDILLIEKNNK